MKNHRFLWLRNRTTDNRKCEKARNIKEKRTIEMFNTVSNLLVVHHSSANDSFHNFKEITKTLANPVFTRFSGKLTISFSQVLCYTWSYFEKGTICERRYCVLWHG